MRGRRKGAKEAHKGFKKAMLWEIDERMWRYSCLVCCSVHARLLKPDKFTTVMVIESENISQLEGTEDVYPNLAMKVLSEARKVSFVACLYVKKRWGVDMGQGRMRKG